MHQLIETFQQPFDAGTAFRDCVVLLGSVYPLLLFMDPSFAVNQNYVNVEDRTMHFSFTFSLPASSISYFL